MTPVKTELNRAECVQRSTRTRLFVIFFLGNLSLGCGSADKTEPPERMQQEHDRKKEETPSKTEGDKPIQKENFLEHQTPEIPKKELEEKEGVPHVQEEFAEASQPDKEDAPRETTQKEETVFDDLKKMHLVAFQKMAESRASAQGERGHQARTGHTQNASPNSLRRSNPHTKDKEVHNTITEPKPSFAPQTLKQQKAHALQYMNQQFRDCTEQLKRRYDQTTEQRVRDAYSSNCKKIDAFYETGFAYIKACNTSDQLGVMFAQRINEMVASLTQIE